MQLTFDKTAQVRSQKGSSERAPGAKQGGAYCRSRLLIGQISLVDGSAARMIIVRLYMGRASGGVAGRTSNGGLVNRAKRAITGPTVVLVLIVPRPRRNHLTTIDDG